MMASLRAWWIALSLREKRLIAVMGALIAIVVAWLGILRPIVTGIDDAEIAHRAAVERTGRIKAGVALLRHAGKPAQPLAGPIDQIVAASAAEAGFALDQTTPSGTDAIAITIASARPPALLAWLDALGQRGLVVDTLSIEPGPNRTVSARITLRKAGS